MSVLEVRELSPRGAGGVSVLELRGDGARAMLSGLCDAELKLGALRLVRPRSGGEELDEALAWCESDERCELHVHGSVPLVRALTAELRARGAKDGAAAALEELLAQAPCEMAARIVLDQLEGAWEREFEHWKQLDAPTLARELASLEERSRAARFALEPARVALAGPVNAGKSTLFNLLVGRERVVVSAVPGTTRDAISERAQLGAWPIELVDTAGERDHEVDALEREGQQLGRTLRAGADLVLWLSPADRPVPPPHGTPATWVTLTSRADLAQTGEPRAVSVHAAPQTALRVVEAALRESLALPESAWEPGAPIALDREARERVGRARAAAAAGDRDRALDLLRPAAR